MKSKKYSMKFVITCIKMRDADTIECASVTWDAYDGDKKLKIPAEKLAHTAMWSIANSVDQYKSNIDTTNEDTNK